MNASFNTNQGRRAGKVVRVNCKTAVVRILEPAPTMIRPCAWRSTNREVMVHLKKDQVKFYPDHVLPGEGY